MTDKTQFGMPCGEFEVLLTEAAEGTLSTPQMQSFRAHAASCSVCAGMFAEALSGHKWLKSLEEAEPPVHLVHNILAATSGREAAESMASAAARKSWFQQARERMVPVLRPVLQPRIAGSFAMALFSISLMLNLAGVKLSDLRHADLRPHAIRSSLSRSYYETTAKVVRYYDSMRFVYELQARVRELKNAATEQAAPQQKPQQDKKDKNNKDMSKRPGAHKGPQKNDEQYSREAGVVLAAYRRKSLNPPPYISMKQQRRDA